VQRASRLIRTLALGALIAGVVPAAANAGSVAGDFNGDGYADLAVGVPGEDLDGRRDVGAVNVIFGSPTRLTTAGNLLLRPSAWDVAERARTGFGSALASGDMNGDGYADLAVGAPADRSGAGRVYVAYGSPSGFRMRPPLDQKSLRGGREAGDRFGSALTAGDFNGDGRDDLAIGVPGEDIRSSRDAGAVNVVYGSQAGLGPRHDWWHQDTPGVDDAIDSRDAFGSALAAADFGRSGHEDLAIGIPGEDLPGGRDAGAVEVLYGSGAPRLTSQNDQLWHQDFPPVADAAEAGDGFGSSLAAANFGGQAQADLAIGIPGEDVGPAADAGAVAVLYGDSSGLRPEGNQLWHQDVADVEDAVEAFDDLASSLAAGPLDGDAFADLAVGVPSEDVGSATAAGAVAVLYGSASGLSAARNQLWHQDVPEILDLAEARDRFGSSFAIGAFGGSAVPGLAIGVPGEERAAADAGAVAVLYGGPGGLSTPSNELWEQGTPGIEDAPETGDAFGSVLAAGI
jgi:hypothetical protein